MKVQLEITLGTEPDEETVRVTLLQAVRELLFNIAKHARVDRASLQLRAADGRQAEITVRDEVAGFDPAMLETRGETEPGFGLFNVRERVETLGGGLEIDSAPGRETRVTVTAPLHWAQVPAARGPSSEPQGDAAARAAPGAGREAGTQMLPTIRVLVADDHPILRKGLADLMDEQTDIELVGEAADGEEAVILARRNHPDVVLMDVTMPKLDGLGATRRIVAEMPGVRVIGLSMHEQDEMAAAMRQAGAVAYLTKGGSSETLLAAIRQGRAL